MSVKPYYENYRYTSKVCTLHSQSIVECRLPGGEISSVLAVNARAVPTGKTCSDGEIRYNGKLLIGIVYEDADKNICRAERGAEFSHHADGEQITPSSDVAVKLRTENVTFRREGSGLYISVIVGAEIDVYKENEAKYLAGGDGLTMRKKPCIFMRTVHITGETETTDEFGIDYVGDILLHSGNATVSAVDCGDGRVGISGEIALNICAMKADGTLCSYERLIPYRMELPCAAATKNFSADASVTVRSAILNAGTDEEKGRSAVSAEFILNADCRVYVKEELSCPDDVFSSENELACTREKKSWRYLDNTLHFTEHVAGTAALTSPIDFSTSIEAAVTPKVSASVTANGDSAEGAVFATVILTDKDGARRACELSLPFIFPVRCDGAEAEAEGVVCGLSIRQRKPGEAEAEGTLKIAVKLYRYAETEYISDVTEGEAYPENKNAVSVYLPKEGDGLWEIAKTLRRPPEEVERNNPELKFPVRAGECIFIYRRKTE